MCSQVEADQLKKSGMLNNGSSNTDQSKDRIIMQAEEEIE